STSLPIALKPKPATIRLVGVEVDGRGGGSKWLQPVCRLS
ncbi:hypothetical protein VN97_g12468, partial [Penicillium thymicola]